MNHLILVLDKSKSWPQNEQLLRFPWNQIVWKRKNVPIFHFFKLTASHMRDLKLKEELELIILRKISKLNSKKIYTKTFNLLTILQLNLYEKFRNYFIFEKQFDWVVTNLFIEINLILNIRSD
ncbi:hypothetical protein BpHYR1_039985 [Brachionus plicatilis]|uniref:Uncharacterized protein n=1 Tax=Brachionus plicatilis TaxID=10195 RepID=A0A3M7SIB6_BRAPC|nr:hypothetical protein BpHYR1_039985 [Brachionus plicatilis]